LPDCQEKRRPSNRYVEALSAFNLLKLLKRCDASKLAPDVHDFVFEEQMATVDAYSKFG
jgi:hypothetical protein